jgi:hypothetical protein
VVSRGSALSSHGIASTTRSAEPVKVPVLSTQMVADASDSIAFSCCASTPPRDMRTAAAA